MVGICHNVWWIEPKSKGLLYLHTRRAPRATLAPAAPRPCRHGLTDARRRAMVAFGNRLWGNEVVMTYLRTGEFRHWAPIRKVTRWTVGAGPRRRVPDARRGACGAAAGAEPRALPRTRAGSQGATSSASTTTPGAAPAQRTSVTLRSDSRGRCLNRLMGRRAGASSA